MATPPEDLRPIDFKIMQTLQALDMEIQTLKFFLLEKGVLLLADYENKLAELHQLVADDLAKQIHETWQKQSAERLRLLLQKHEGTKQ